MLFLKEFLCNFVIKQYQIRMCYLKNIDQHENLDFDDIFHKAEDQSSEQTEVENKVVIPSPHKHAISFWSRQQQMLSSLFQMIERNNCLIKTMQSCLKSGSQQVEKNSIQTENQIENDNLSLPKQSQQYPTITQGQEQNLCSKLFGAKKYKYSLQLTGQFPNVIYKQRNFNLPIRLVDELNKPVRNSNIVSLCCAVSTSTAEWIHENRVGQKLLKGKTQVQLYNGEAAFLKLYAREVSRVYPQGKVNLVIYAKPSTLLYSGPSSFNLSISSEDVQPLIIQDLVIKAKKKQ